MLGLYRLHSLFCDVGCHDFLAFGGPGRLQPLIVPTPNLPYITPNPSKGTLEIPLKDPQTVGSNGF